jgi:hypothetical protein
MYTTNTASAGLAGTYQVLRRELEGILEIARKLEKKALDNPKFLHDPEFQALKGKCREQLISISGLINC